MPYINPMSASMMQAMARMGLEPAGGGFGAALANTLGTIAEAIAQRREMVTQMFMTLLNLLSTNEEAQRLIATPQVQQFIKTMFPELAGVFEDVDLWKMIQKSISRQGETEGETTTTTVEIPKLSVPPLPSEVLRERYGVPAPTEPTTYLNVPPLMPFPIGGAWKWLFPEPELTLPQVVAGQEPFPLTEYLSNVPYSIIPAVLGTTSGRRR